MKFRAYRIGRTVNEINHISIAVQNTRCALLLLLLNESTENTFITEENKDRNLWNKPTVFV